MKNLLKALLLLLALLLPAIAVAHDFEVDGIYYTITSDTTVEAVSHSSNSNSLIGVIDVVIPNSVAYNGVNYSVSAIGDYAFYGNQKIHEITLPETITSIGISAFKNCPNLKFVTCLGLTPPSINESFDQHSKQDLFEALIFPDDNQWDLAWTISINEFTIGLLLFVPYDAYPNYKAVFQNSNYFSYITSREKTASPRISSTEDYDVTISSTEESIVYTRISEAYNQHGPSFIHAWDTETWYHLHATTSSSGITHYVIQAFAIAEGKLPSDINSSYYSLSEPSYKYYDFEEDGIYYNILDNDDGSVEVTRGAEYVPSVGENVYPYTGDIVIPSSVRGYSVTSIGQEAFNNCTGLTSVSIPNSITTIVEETFAGCSALTSVSIPNSVITIGAAAFSDCTALESLTIPNSVTNIGAWAFQYCTGLTSITIGNSVTEIGVGAFLRCNRSLTSVEVANDNPNYDSRNNCNAIIETATNTLILGCKNTVIPNSVTAIEGWAFYACSELTNITIPNSVTDIDDSAFYECNNLTSVTCLATTPPISVYYDGWYRLFEENVYQNATLYVPFSAVEAYRNAPGWSNFHIIVGINDYDFEVDGVFYKKTSDNEVMVAHGEEAYQGVVFVPCAVTIEGVTYEVTGIDYAAFANDTLTNLVLPVTINTIDSTAFTDCLIHSLVITGNGTWTAGAVPATVDQLFVMSGVDGIHGLQVNPASVYSYSTVPPTCNEQTFTGYDGALHVPASSLAAYFTAPYWSNFINITGDAVEPTGITLSKDSVDLLIGTQMTLTATPTPANATPGDIIWFTSDASVATVDNGEITAVGVGECDIKVILLDKIVACHVTVTEIAPTALTLNQEFAKLEIGSQLTLTATVQPDDATDKTVTWATSNPDVATVDDLGNVIAVGTGECSITATCRDMQASCHVVVVEHLIFITLDQHEARLLPNHILILTPAISPASTDVVVTSSNPAVAAARMANGKIQVVGITEGVTTVTVNSADGLAEADSCIVKVYTDRGDVNCDGFVNISDVTGLINYLLTDNESPFDPVNADTNNDQSININDVTRLISFLLVGEELDPKDEPVDPEVPESEVQTFTVNGVSFKMVTVDGGTFMMGATPEQGENVRENEKPVHEVTLKPFIIGQTEVTQELWQAVMGSNPSHHTGDMQRPVDMVSWVDCQEFITRLNQLTGKTFRLPTEAEWEYAARGGNKSQGYRYAGSNDMLSVAWCSDNSENSTHPVATKAPNELGLHDMTGNVWEWCNDWYARYTADPQVNPAGPDTAYHRVLRGGCWNGGDIYNRISYRDNFTPTGSNSSGGLRLAMDNVEVYTVNGVSFTMVPVKGGTFTMGATVEEDADYQVFIGSPQHQVTLTDFSIGQTEVTQELWVAVMGSNPSQNKGDLQRPVECVSWFVCDTFIMRLNALTGKNFRLQTEAEWEYAAKGGSLSRGFTYSGSDSIDAVAWYLGNSDGTTHPVATKAPNELGLYDMNGNVSEWCNDWFYLYTEEPMVDPTGPVTGGSRVHRGGRYHSGVKYCRLTRRDGFTPVNARHYLGLRLALKE